MPKLTTNNLYNRVFCADAGATGLPGGHVDLVFGSPPYCDARTYGIGAQRDCQSWIDWMMKVTTECLRVSRGPVIWVVAGVTRDRSYWPAPEGLLYEWWKAGGSSYRPVYWKRVGIPGSGGDQWFRADVESCLCFKRKGKLPWTDNTACGLHPKWGVGGTMSHRAGATSRALRHGGVASETDPRVSTRKFGANSRQHTKSRADGSDEIQTYIPPAISNPGNLIHTIVGGGQMGSKLAHENEAPYPEALAEFFVKSLCPVNGVVYDPFSGSGTTASVAIKHGRRYLASDIRESQVELTQRRITEATMIVQGRTPHAQSKQAPGS